MSLTGRVLPGLSSLRTGLHHSLATDVLVGLSVWAITVPQGLAYGELAGLSPVAGLYTALGAVLYVLIGSSRCLVVGPDSSVAIVTAAYIAPLAAGSPDRAAELAALLALGAGAFLALGALLRLGVLARLLSTPILAGYLTGAAFVIAVSQIGRMLGIPTPGAEWWDKLHEAAVGLPEANGWAVAFAALTVGTVLVLRRLLPRWPGILIAIAAATGTVAAFGLSDRLPVVGEVDGGIPVPGLPDVGGGDVGHLVVGSASIALLIFASSLLTGDLLARPEREEVTPRRELLGLAAACTGSGLLQGFPANASETRSFVAVKSGGRSQVVNVVATLLVVVTLLFVTPAFQYLPQAALAAVVFLAAVSMINTTSLRRLWRVRRSDFVLATATFVGVLAFDVLSGIAVGVVISLLEVLRRAVLPPTAVLGRVAGRTLYGDLDPLLGVETETGLIVYRFDAPLFFANAAVLREQVLALVDSAPHPVREVVLDAEGIVDLDITGAEALDRLIDDLDALGVRLVLARLRQDLRQTLLDLGIAQRLPEGSFPLRIQDAVSSFRQSS